MKNHTSNNGRLRTGGARIVTAPPGPNARKMLARDKKVVSPSYPRDYPFVMERGRGAEVWDVDRNRYIDCMAGIAVAATGHSHPKLVQALQAQSEKFIHISSDFYHESMIRLGERINEIAPMQEDVGVFFANSGTEAVEAAIKLARYATKRQRFIGFLGAFHGRSMGSLSFTASKYVQQERFFPTMPGVVHVPFPDPYRPVLDLKREGDYGDTVVDYIERVIFQTVLPPDECAAILLEPIQGEGGYVVPPQNFFPRLRQMCDKHGIILIADEVQSGVGRTGKWWAIEHWGVEPDIVCSAKGIASGVPLGLMFARQSIMKQWVAGAHGNTYGGNPLACTAALTTLDLVEDGMMENAAEQGEFIMDALAEMQVRHPSMGDVRGKGLMIGVEFVQDKTTKQPAPQLRQEIVNHAFQNGLLLLGCGRSTIRIAPPLMIQKPLVEEALELFEDAVTSAEKKHKML
ncbi:MAG: acetyl ornithine aminotransferase family protein [Chloroflexota bacterium]|nr:MAG: acetyl ornithine aminotransferase family protein [Chloroflexota bacterium]